MTMKYAENIMTKKVSKKDIITEIFNICKLRNDFAFDNVLVKEVLRKMGSKTNPYDITKLDDTSKFPSILIQRVSPLVIIEFPFAISF